MVAMFRLWAMFVALTLSLTATNARANPDIWVESTITIVFDDQQVSGLEFSWAFDNFYSAHTIQTYDLDGDGTLNSVEVKNLRAGTFDPLSPADYFVHIWSGEKKHEGVYVDRFTARIERTRLVYEFSVGLTPPLDPKTELVIVSMFDRENIVDFSFAGSPFLLVSGEMTPGCKFRIARGKGAHSGHPQQVTLACDG